MDALIEQAYRQVFFHAMRSDREPFLNHNSAAATSPFGISSVDCFYPSDSSRAITSAARTTEWWIRWWVVFSAARFMAMPNAESIVIAGFGLRRYLAGQLGIHGLLGYDLIPQQRSRVLPGQPRATCRFTTISAVRSRCGILSRSV